MFECPRCSIISRYYFNRVMLFTLVPLKKNSKNEEEGKKTKNLKVLHSLDSYSNVAK